MPAASELQAHLAWRLLVTETAPPPAQVDDDQNVSTPVANKRLPSSPSAGVPSLVQRGSAIAESKVQLTDAYSARCHWRPKRCGECDKLRLLNSQLVGRLQAAEAHITILTRDYLVTLEELSSRFMSEGINHKLLETKLADIQPYMDLLAGITAEVNSRRLDVSVSRIHTKVGTTEISTPAASIAWIGVDAYSTPVKVCMDTAISPSCPASPKVELTLAYAASGKHSPEDSPLEECDSNQLDRSQRSLEDALLKSLEVTAETCTAASPSPKRSRPVTPDWPRQRQSQASVASSADTQRPFQRPGSCCGLGSCQRPRSSCGPRQKLVPGKARVEPGSHERPPVPLPNRRSSRPRQNTEQRMSSC